MPRKTSDQHQANSRLGALGESLVQTFLLEYADFCFPTQEKHPADLIVEFGNAKYTVQVKSRRATKEKKFVFAAENSRSMSDTYRNYTCDILAFVFFYDDQKRIMFKSNTSSQNYFTFDKKVITDTMELDSLQESLDTLSAVPVLNPII
jgi:hypothetical protein